MGKLTLLFVPIKISLILKKYQISNLSVNEVSNFPSKKKVLEGIIRRSLKFRPQTFTLRCEIQYHDTKLELDIFVLLGRVVRR